MEEQKENINNSENNNNDNIEEERHMDNSYKFDGLDNEKIFNNEFDRINIIGSEDEEDNSPFIIYEELHKKRKFPTFDMIEAIYNIESIKRK